MLATLDADKHKHLELVILMTYLTSPYLFVISLKSMWLIFMPQSSLATREPPIGNKWYSLRTPYHSIALCAFMSFPSPYDYEIKKKGSNNTILFDGMFLDSNTSKCYLLADS